MQRISCKTTGLAIALAFALAGSVQAQQQQQHQQHHPGGAQSSQQQPAGAGPGAPTQPQMTEQMQSMMGNMQGMMQHMQGMMEHMQGMMSGSGIMGRRGMMGRQGMMGMGGMMARQGMMAQEEDEDEETSPQSGMMGMGGMMDRGMMGRHGMMSRHGMMGMGKMMGHGGMIQHHLERLAQQLELTDEQRTQMWSVLGNQAKEAFRLQADLGTLAIDLRQLLDADPVDLAKAKPLLQSIAGKEADLRLLHITAMQDMSKILTPEQRQKLRTIRRGMMGHSGMMGMGGRMGSGGMRGQRPAAQ
jgi:Spy/CpxP family protein refolding chaperone